MTSFSELARVFIEYAGPFDDPRIGWCGHGASGQDMFKCERCGREHLDSSKIEHDPNCSAMAAIKMLAALKKLSVKS